MCESILQSDGFIRLGELHYKLNLSLWWKPEKLIQISHIPLDPYHLLWGQMCYYAKAIGEQGETFIRDIPSLFKNMQAHFPALNMVFTFYRDTTPEMNLKRIQEKGTRAGQFCLNLTEDNARLESIRNRYNDTKKEFARSENLIHLAGKNDPLLNKLHSNLQRRIKLQMENQREEGTKLQNEIQRGRKIIEAYKNKTHGSSLIISVFSTFQLAYGKSDSMDRLNMIQKELLDQDAFII